MKVYDGIRVLDFTVHVQGPLCTQMLADFGAEVIKIERPDHGDMLRGRNADRGINHMAGYSPAFAAFNRNKKSLAINLKSPRGKEMVRELARQSDVVVANLHPGVLERLGFGYEELRQLNPRLIVALGSGYGQTGPERDTPGQEMAAQARSGVLMHNVCAGQPPVACGFNLLEYVSGLLLAQGIMLALTAREQTGRGQLVDANFLNAGVAIEPCSVSAYLNQGGYKTAANANPPNPAYTVYETADGRWVQVIDTFADQPRTRMAQAVGLPDGLTDFAEQFRAAARRLPCAELIQRLQEAGMMAVRVNELPEVVADPQVAHNEMVIAAEHTVVGAMKLVGFPLKLSETPATLRSAPPLLGEHNEEILSELLGISDVEIAKLYATGILGRYQVERTSV